jgi:hypothetical protein
LKNMSERWKRLDAGTSRLEQEMTKPKADGLKLVRKYLDVVHIIFPQEDTTPEGQAVYHLAAAIKASLKGLEAFPKIDLGDLPKLSEVDLTALQTPMEPLNIEMPEIVFPEEKDCPLCGKPK